MTGFSIICCFCCPRKGQKKLDFQYQSLFLVSDIQILLNHYFLLLVYQTKYFFINNFFLIIDFQYAVKQSFSNTNIYFTYVKVLSHHFKFHSFKYVNYLLKYSLKWSVTTPLMNLRSFTLQNTHVKYIRKCRLLIKGAMTCETFVCIFSLHKNFHDAIETFMQ